MTEKSIYTNKSHPLLLGEAYASHNSASSMIQHSRHALQDIKHYDASCLKYKPYGKRSSLNTRTKAADSRIAHQRQRVIPGIENAPVLVDIVSGHQGGAAEHLIQSYILPRKHTFKLE